MYISSYVLVFFPLSTCTVNCQLSCIQFLLREFIDTYIFTYLRVCKRVIIINRNSNRSMLYVLVFGPEVGMLYCYISSMSILSGGSKYVVVRAYTALCLQQVAAQALVVVPLPTSATAILTFLTRHLLNAKSHQCLSVNCHQSA